MAQYKMDMNSEKAPGVQFPTGWNKYNVENCVAMTSKKGNEMFKVTIALSADKTVAGDVYAITEPGKRWFLKQLLASCGIPAGTDGIYEFDIGDLLDKPVMAQGIPQEETWIDREGNNRTSTKTKLVAFKPVEEVEFP